MATGGLPRLPRRKKAKTTAAKGLTQLRTRSCGDFLISANGLLAFSNTRPGFNNKMKCVAGKMTSESACFRTFVDLQAGGCGCARKHPKTFEEAPLDIPSRKRHHDLKLVTWHRSPSAEDSRPRRHSSHSRYCSSCGWVVGWQRPGAQPRRPPDSPFHQPQLGAYEETLAAPIGATHHP